MILYCLIGNSSFLLSVVSSGILICLRNWLFCVPASRKVPPVLFLMNKIYNWTMMDMPRSDRPIKRLFFFLILSGKQSIEVKICFGWYHSRNTLRHKNRLFPFPCRNTSAPYTWHEEIQDIIGRLQLWSSSSRNFIPVFISMLCENAPVNWNTGGSFWTSNSDSLHWGQLSTATGCPGRLWPLPPWKHSKAILIMLGSSL